MTGHERASLRTSERPARCEAFMGAPPVGLVDLTPVRGAPMSDGTTEQTHRLAAISFQDELRAVELMTAMTRLAREGKLRILDAVFVVKAEDSKTYVRETTDLQPGQTALGTGLWSGLFGLILGGPVGMLVAGGIGAGAGALTAKLVDVGVTDEFVSQLRELGDPRIWIIGGHGPSDDRRAHYFDIFINEFMPEPPGNKVDIAVGKVLNTLMTRAGKTDLKDEGDDV